MPDITMCNARACPASANCVRHPDSGTKPKEHTQSWWQRDGDEDVGESCGYYWPKIQNQ